jgi:TRAP-type C4-dicarboxylate transport system permease small subunit
MLCPDHDTALAGQAINAFAMVGLSDYGLQLGSMHQTQFLADALHGLFPPTFAAQAAVILNALCLVMAAI